MQRVLEGTKVLDMGHVVAGPSGASVLADWGAEVIKIEPLRGEWIRHYHGHMEADPVVEVDGQEVNWLVELLNRGKKGLAIDLKNELGRVVLHRMVEHADVFLSNYEASTLEKLDLDYDTLSAINNMVWQDLGLDEDPGLQYDVGVTLAAVAGTVVTGTIALRMEYSAP